VWVSAAPLLPHPAGGDSLAILATRSDQVWSRVAPFDSLPQLLNPPGGYVRNENDSPHYTNLNRILPDTFPFWVEAPRLRLRSQHGLELLHNDRVFSLEDVVEAKHSMRMLLADRVKDDLIAAVRTATTDADLLRAAALLEEWDNTVAADSRGGVLFEAWWDRYRALARGELHAVEWSAAEPATTPRGLARSDLAAQAFEAAVYETARVFGGYDVAWGDVHRVRRGSVDVPVGGCGGALGCFRVLSFGTAADGRRVANGGDGWVLAVEFGEQPRAFSVLAYGQSPDPRSPYHADQAAMFAAGRMKPVRWTEQDRARPGRALSAGHGASSPRIRTAPAAALLPAGLVSKVRQHQDQWPAHCRSPTRSCCLRRIRCRRRSCAP
jgi:acyl-homoserine-lactone acylase